MKALIYCLLGMKRKTHGAQEPRHIQRYVEVTSTAQRSDSPAQAINQRFLRAIAKLPVARVADKRLPCHCFVSASRFEKYGRKNSC